MFFTSTIREMKEMRARIAQAEPVQEQKQNGDQVQLRECDPDNCVLHLYVKIV